KGHFMSVAQGLGLFARRESPLHFQYRPRAPNRIRRRSPLRGAPRRLLASQPQATDCTPFGAASAAGVGVGHPQRYTGNRRVSAATALLLCVWTASSAGASSTSAIKWASSSH